MITENTFFRLLCRSTLLVMAYALINLSYVQAENSTRFYQANIAKCFYCDESTEISPVDIHQPSKELVDLQEADAKLPLPFQQLIKAYESGDEKATYKAAQAWVEYQDRIISRTSALAVLVAKARKELQANSELANVDLVPSQTKRSNTDARSLPVHVIFFFDARNLASQVSAEVIQLFYDQSISDANIEVVGIPESSNTLSEISEFKQTSKITFPVQFSDQLTRKLSIENYPTTIVALKDSSAACPLATPFNTENLIETIKSCRLTDSSSSREVS